MEEGFASIDARHSSEVVWCTQEHRFLTPKTIGRGTDGIPRHRAIHRELGGLSPHLVTLARELRHNGTTAEEQLWDCLRARRLGGAKFRRQHPLGAHYIADFYCAEHRLAIELDGSVHDSGRARWADGIRHRQIQTSGVRVLRFRNEQILNDLEGALAEIAQHLTAIPPLHSVERGPGGEVRVEEGVTFPSPPDPLSACGEGEKERCGTASCLTPQPPLRLRRGGDQTCAPTETSLTVIPPLHSAERGPGGEVWREASELKVGDLVVADEHGRVARIADIEYSHSEQSVYDLTVEEDHSFVTRAGVAHNCGSGTTAYVAEQWGRRWITCDTSRVALALARTRLMAAKYPYYLLADSPEGIKKERELGGETLTAESRPAGTTSRRPLSTTSDIKRGFVYKRVPHVTLKSIANNPEIDTIHAKWQEKLGALRDRLNAVLKQTWEEWQVPRQAEDKWSKEAQKLHEEFWHLRRARQQEIDAAIARHAETETLYDQPYEDNKRVRVCGPFTVESLSPHRTISVEEKKRCREHWQYGRTIRTIGPDDFGRTILENLRKAGVQNTRQGERLKFDSLDIYPGEWIHGAGTYADAAGTPKRAAICIGPEHGTVGAQLIKEAAKEAVKGIGFDVLIVCGFAFDPSVSEEAKRYGKLVVLPTKMNPDLAMGDELLKKTGAGNLFMVFGEPDVEVVNTGDSVQVTLRGLDVYDPTTGQIRNSATDDIACWFIDTDYNGESFFVRQAYFTGADEPYEKLKRALRSAIDEAAWSSLYRTESQPFPKPKSGKIAVKVINHYGDEVLKVFDV